MNDVDAEIFHRVRKILTPLKSYTVEEVLGSGAMGYVVLVNHKVFGRRAIKLVSQGLSSSPTLRTRFENEAKIMDRINNPHVVKVYDMGEVGEFPEDHPYIIMEYMPGGCLADHLDEFGPMPARQAVHVTIAILKGLQAAHDEKIVHRDIKPENVLFDLDGNVKVADFGIAMVGADLKRLTNDGNAIGTMAFMSFEQLDGAADIDGRADQYAVGVTLFQMVANMDLQFEPFFSQLARKPHWWDPVPEVLKGIIKKATSILPEQRFESANAMIQALEECLAELPEDSIVTQKLGSAPARTKALQKRLSFKGVIDRDAVDISGWGDAHVFQGDESVIAQVPGLDAEQDEGEAWEYYPPSDDAQIQDESFEISAEEAPEDEVESAIIEVPSSRTIGRRLVWIVCVTIVVYITVFISGEIWFERQTQQESLSHYPFVVESEFPLQTQETNVPIIHETPLSEVPVSRVTPIPIPLKKPKVVKLGETIQMSSVSTTPRTVPEIPHPEPSLPDSQVRVLLKADTTAKVVLTGEKGTFVITGGVLAIPEGIYQVSVDLPGRSQPQTGSLTIRSGMTTITCDARFKMCTGLK